MAPRLTKAVRAFLPLASMAAVFACGANHEQGFGDGGAFGGRPDGGSSSTASGPGQSLFGDDPGRTRSLAVQCLIFIDTATYPPTRASLTYTATYDGNDVSSELSLSLAGPDPRHTFLDQTFTSAREPSPAAPSA